MINAFGFARIPRIEFGAGKFSMLPDIVSTYGKKALIISGGGFLDTSGKLDALLSGLNTKGISASVETVTNEPSPNLIDTMAQKYRENNISVIVSVGGGSAVDSGKAVSAMLKIDKPVEGFLEGIAKDVHPGMKVPFIAVPTTSGTGSEATKNAVLSKVGLGGYKRSLRHDNFVPDIALIDPELMLTCPGAITASCGMDAFVQLLESYVSVKPTPMTDALALSGMEAVGRSLVSASTTGAGDIGIRSDMAYGALMSGITLANAGLGVIHGFASTIGGFFNIPHGVICGTLLAAATKKNIEVLKQKEPDGVQLKKHARAGALLRGKTYDDSKLFELCDMLTDVLYDWSERLQMPLLGRYGVTEADIDRIAAATELKNNAVKLTREDIAEILKERI
jgi:alcohol dehydrogenase class IV